MKTPPSHLSMQNDLWHIAVTPEKYQYQWYSYPTDHRNRPNVYSHMALYCVRCSLISAKTGPIFIVCRANTLNRFVTNLLEPNIKFEYRD